MNQFVQITLAAHASRAAIFSLGVGAS